MSKLTAYWENYDRFYDDFQKEGLNLDDLLFKSKLNFLDNKLTFSHKSKFNFSQKGASASHELGLKHKCKHGTKELKEKAGEFSLETELNHVEKDNIKVGSFHKTVVKHGENGHSSNVKVQLRVHHKDNALVTLGVEDWNACSGHPRVFALGGSYGKATEGKKHSFNGLLHFNIETRFLQLARFFVLHNQGDFTGLFEANIKRSQNESNESNNAIDLTAKFTKQVCEKVKVGGLLYHDIDSKKTNAEVVVSKKFDRLTFHGKVTSNREALVGITSVRDDLTLNVALKKTLRTKPKDEGEGNRHWFDMKFGASVEFNRL